MNSWPGPSRAAAHPAWRRQSPVKRRTTRSMPVSHHPRHSTSSSPQLALFPRLRRLSPRRSGPFLAPFLLRAQLWSPCLHECPPSWSPWQASHRMRVHLRITPHGGGARKPGSANATARCARPTTARKSRAGETDSDSTAAAVLFWLYWGAAGAGQSSDFDWSSRSSPASSRTGIFSSSALASFEPASSPATT